MVNWLMGSLCDGEMSLNLLRCRNDPDFLMIVMVCNVIGDWAVLNVSQLIPDTSDTCTLQIRDELQALFINGGCSILVLLLCKLAYQASQ